MERGASVARAEVVGQRYIFDGPRGLGSRKVQFLIYVGEY